MEMPAEWGDKMIDVQPLSAWSVRAVNLAEHANNAVHTDTGARAAGHERALVAGTTVYAYLTHVPAAAWGDAWLTGGGGEVRFRSPVFDDDAVECVPTSDGGIGGDRVEAWSRGELRATFDVWREGTEVLPMRGAPLPELSVELDDALVGYGARTGDDLGIYAQRNIVHPVITTTMGNRATMASVVDGPWIHVRSHVTHQGIARPGEILNVQSSLADRFQSRAGERVILDVRISVDERPIAAVEHESIVRLV